MSLFCADKISTIYAKSASTQQINAADLQMILTIHGQIHKLAEEEQNCIKRLLWLVRTGRVQVLEHNRGRLGR